jgi:hypothetical protein
MSLPIRPQASPQRAPLYNLIRFITVADVGPYTKKGLGCDWSTFLQGMVQIVPINTADIKALDAGGDVTALQAGATSNPAFTVRYWNEEMGLWLVKNPTLLIAAAGAGLAYEVDLPNVNGRRIFLECTGGITASQAVLVFAAGAMHHESL